jgi:O-methyltransferase involved in polyketide biosynthesis
VGCFGLVYFLSDEQVQHLMTRLHAFCAPGSTLALSNGTTPDGVVEEDLAEIVRELSRVSRMNIYPRTPERLAQVIAPWRVTANEPFASWLPDQEPAVRGNHPMERFEFFGVLADHE